MAQMAIAASAKPGGQLSRGAGPAVDSRTAAASIRGRTRNDNTEAATTAAMSTAEAEAAEPTVGASQTVHWAVPPPLEPETAPHRLVELARQVSPITEGAKDQRDSKGDLLSKVKNSRDELKNKVVASAHDAKCSRDELKEKVRARLNQPPYDVSVYYHKTGVFRTIATNKVFEKITLAVIGVNAIWIAVDTDWNTSETLSEAEWPFQVAEHSFCTFFTFEWFVRFMSFKRKRDGLRDGWFVFDSMLVFSMVLETWILLIVAAVLGGAGGNPFGNTSMLRIARLLRLSRMARMGRLLRQLPELLILIRGVAAASRSVLFALLLLLIILYVFSIAFVQLTEGLESKSVYFGNIPDAMYHLLIDGTFMDNFGTALYIINRDSSMCMALFLLFVLATNLLVLNMLIGVLCEVVSTVSTTEKDQIMLAWTEEKLQRVVDHIDDDGNRLVSKKEFLKIFDDEEAALFLTDVGVDVIGLVDFVDFIFDDTDSLSEDKEKTLSFQEFLTIVLNLRGHNQASVRDVVDLRKFVKAQVSEIGNITEAKVGLVDKKLGAFATALRRGNTQTMRRKPTRSRTSLSNGSQDDVIVQSTSEAMSAASDMAPAPPPRSSTRKASRTNSGATPPEADGSNGLSKRQNLRRRLQNATAKLREIAKELNEVGKARLVNQDTMRSSKTVSDLGALGVTADGKSSTIYPNPANRPRFARHDAAKFGTSQGTRPSQAGSNQEWPSEGGAAHSAVVQDTGDGPPLPTVNESLQDCNGGPRGAASHGTTPGDPWLMPAVDTVVGNCGEAK